ncbi:sensor histidine kinase [Neptunicella marina]|uniref:Histidine kinase n=1 Tax=Neptunicella marina TaxID=2125989 RepID=A0A8J6M0C1_9ALTE|nr:histidine kinase [Neptunicella marina]MBC3767064.1 histidine kinase [Neptunicella marina]
MSLLPVLTALVVEGSIRQFSLHSDSLPGYALILLQLAVEFSPLFLTQWYSQKYSGVQKALVWMGGFIVYPAINLLWISELSGNKTLFSMQGEIIAVCLSLLYAVHQFYQQQQQKPGIWRKLLNLDAVVILLLFCWAFTMTGMFVYTDDPLRNQPFPAIIDFGKMWDNLGLTFYFLAQFLVLASMIFSYYWLNRYLFIRNILAKHGMVAYLMSSCVFVFISYPLLVFIAMQLPWNLPEFSVTPSQNYNPFAPDNFRFATAVWLVSTPIILVFERQQTSLQLAELEQSQLSAEIKMLQQQVNPHFLFNTLNGLYALCLKNAANAGDMLLKLADLLRYTVYQGQKKRVLLQDEIDYLQNYLSLQMMRVDNKCELNISIPSIPQDATIAPLLLVMLVENAFKHGVEPSDEKSWVTIHLEIIDGQIQFECTNSLAPKHATHEQEGGVGLANLKRRLTLQYPQSYQLSSEPTGAAEQSETNEPTEKYWRATLCLPLN